MRPKLDFARAKPALRQLGETSMKFFNRTLLLAFLAFGCLQAQDITKGTIAGVVRDASGAVVPEATVRLTSPYGDRSTTSNGSGEYSFHNLVVGPGYNLTDRK